jgi:hypothetical protein
MHLTLWTRVVGHQALLLRQDDRVRPQVNRLHQVGWPWLAKPKASLHTWMISTTVSPTSDLSHETMKWWGSSHTDYAAPAKDVSHESVTQDPSKGMADDELDWAADGEGGADGTVIAEPSV